MVDAHDVSHTLPHQGSTSYKGTHIKHGVGWKTQLVDWPELTHTASAVTLAADCSAFGTGRTFTGDVLKANAIHVSVTFSRVEDKGLRQVIVQ